MSHVEATYRNEDFFHVLGQISVFFATWDFVLTTIIVRLVRPDIPIPDLERSTLGQKLKILGSLSHETVTVPRLLDRIREALPAASGITNERNRFMHDQWVFNPANISIGKIERLTLNIGEYPAGRTYSFDKREFRIEDLYIFLSAVGEQQKVFAALLEDLPV